MVAFAKDRHFDRPVMTETTLLEIWKKLLLLNTPIRSIKLEFRKGQQAYIPEEKET